MLAEHAWGRGARATICAVNTALIGERSAMQEWSLLVPPAVLGTISIFVVVMARLESRLFE